MAGGEHGLGVGGAERSERRQRLHGFEIELPGVHQRVDAAARHEVVFGEPLGGDALEGGDERLELVGLDGQAGRVLVAAELLEVLGARLDGVVEMKAARCYGRSRGPNLPTRRS